MCLIHKVFFLLLRNKAKIFFFLNQLLIKKYLLFFAICDISMTSRILCG